MTTKEKFSLSLYNLFSIYQSSYYSYDNINRDNLLYKDACIIHVSYTNNFFIPAVAFSRLPIYCQLPVGTYIVKIPSPTRESYVNTEIRSVETFLKHALSETILHNFKVKDDKYFAQMGIIQWDNRETMLLGGYTVNFNPTLLKFELLERVLYINPKLFSSEDIVSKKLSNCIIPIVKEYATTSIPYSFHCFLNMRNTTLPTKIIVEDPSFLVIRGDTNKSLGDEISLKNILQNNIPTT